MTISWPTASAMRPATTTTSPFMASRAERIGSAVLAMRRSEPPKYRIHNETMESRDRLPRYCSQKAERSLCQRRASGEHGLAEGDDQEKSTPLDHVVCVKATWLEPLRRV
jgi:hypothetical protein